MSFENATQLYCGVLSKGGKGSDAQLRKLPEKTLLAEKRFLRKATAEKIAENQARKSRAASVWRDSVSGFWRDFRQASF